MKALLVTSIFFLTSTILPAQGPATWDQSTAYTHPALVINGTTTYISLEDVPANTAITNTTYWATLDSLVPTDTPSGADSLTAPDASEVENLTVPDSNSSSGASFWGLAIRGSVGDYPIAGGITIKGNNAKQVMIRVKGPTMNFAGAKVSDPKITITKLNDAGTAYDPYLEVDNWGDHAATASNNSDLATADSKEPVAVLDLEPWNLWCKSRRFAGGTGSANVEFYGMESDTGDGRFFGLAIRGSVGDYPIAGGITIKGSSAKKVMIRVKGPTMNFAGAKVSDPKITITKLNDAGTAYDPYLEVDNWGDHAATASNNSDLATADSKEPVAVLDLEPGTYGVRVEDVAGGTGSANVEFYEQE